MMNDEMMKGVVIVLVAGAMMIAGCGRTAPQKPSQRNGVRNETTVDTAALALLSINQRLADAADKEVLSRVTASETTKIAYSQNEVGSWERWLVRNNEGESPKQDEQWTLHLVVKTLDGEMLLDSEASYHIGRDELPLAVEAALQEAKHGDQIEIVCPWYTAYGAIGNNYVKAYQNVIIEVYIR